MKIDFCQERQNKGVQTVRLDELNNIVTWAGIRFIFQNKAKTQNTVNCGQSRRMAPKMINFDKMAVSQRYEIEI